ncbi:hypothetical protein AX27061_2662 [Achromobacter xylosoxidans NBRC 15126 = ATCC 27061]|nr:hypothetical protein AX27061_2662 [Achromobacter xylosoxidans NBRC 15126 = ATCC 27061]CCH08435.1 hypothetical protein NH44784_044921 [Achromobacter xylosoxidans NH44784-1996]
MPGHGDQRCFLRAGVSFSKRSAAPQSPRMPLIATVRPRAASDKTDDKGNRGKSQQSLAPARRTGGHRLRWRARACRR